MATTALDLVRRVRRLGRDRPDRTRITDATGIDENTLTITLPAGHQAKLPQAGTVLEPDDGFGELIETVDRSDSNVIDVYRGFDGTQPSAHETGTVLLIKPRWFYADVIEALDTVIGLEFWPHVWVPGELELTYQSSDDFYPLPVAGVDEVSHVYQLQSGRFYQLAWKLISPELGDNANFPNGGLAVPGAFAGSQIYVAYRGQPTILNLTGDLEKLAVMGALANLVMTEESVLVGPDTRLVDTNLQAGSRLRAGAVLWQRFEGARSTTRIALQETEDARRRQLTGR